MGNRFSAITFSVYFIAFSGMDDVNYLRRPSYEKNIYVNLQRKVNNFLKYSSTYIPKYHKYLNI